MISPDIINLLAEDDIHKGFDSLFFLFNLVGLPIFPQRLKQQPLRRTCFGIVGVLFFLLTIYDIVAILYSIGYNIVCQLVNKRFILDSMYHLTQTLLRCLILWKFPVMTRIPKRLVNLHRRMTSSVSGSMQKTFRFFLRFVIGTHLVSFAFYCIVTFGDFEAMKEILEKKTLHLNLGCSPLTMMAGSVLVIFLKLIVFEIPRSLFIVYFATTCYTLKTAIGRFRDDMSRSTSSEDHNRMIKILGELHETTKQVDDSLSLIIFAVSGSVIQGVMGSMYDIFMLTGHNSLVLLQRISVLACNAILFLVITGVGRVMYQAGQQMIHVVHTLPPEKSTRQKKLLLTMRIQNSELCMTLWKMMHLNNNFILTAGGAILSYFLILMNL